MGVQHPVNVDDHTPLPTGPKSEARGIPAVGAMDQGVSEPLGSSGMHHWRQSTVTDQSLDERGNIFSRLSR